jgi:hypothetical protein
MIRVDTSSSGWVTTELEYRVLEEYDGFFDKTVINRTTGQYYSEMIAKIGRNRLVISAACSKFEGKPII